MTESAPEARRLPTMTAMELFSETQLSEPPFSQAGGAKAVFRVPFFGILIMGFLLFRVPYWGCTRDMQGVRGPLGDPGIRLPDYRPTSR